MQYADRIVKQYLQHAQRNGAVVDPFGDYQDPTYLGFYFYISTTSTDNTSAVVDYAYDFYTDGLFRPNDDPNGAYHYLKSRGETYRAEMIAEFRDKFLSLTNNYPWYFISVSGLADLWKFEPKQNYRGKDKKLTFETLESVDLKMTYLIDLYRKAVFDTRYMRYMLPENLRFFNAEIYVAEIRSMQSLASPGEQARPVDESLTRRYSDRTLDATVAALGGDALGISGNQLREGNVGGIDLKGMWNDPGKSLKDLIVGKGNSKYPLNLSSFNELATFMKFELGGCEFDVFNDAPKYLDTLQNSATEAAKMNFNIKVHYVKETNTYGLLGAVLKDTQYFQDRTKPMKLDGAKYGTAISDYGVITKRDRDANDQQKRQSEIEEANAGLFGGLGGLAGNMVNQGINTAIGQLGDAKKEGGQSINDLGKAFKKGLLGNVYSDQGPSASEIIASSTSANLIGAAQQILSRATSPELAAAILDNVILESPLLNTAVSPEKSEGGGGFSSSGIDPSSNLEGNPGTTAGDTDGGNNAIFVVKGTEPSVNLVGGLSNVPLVGPSSSSISTPKVELESAPISDAIQPKVELTGIGDINGTPGKVVLDGEGSLEGDTGKTELIGEGSLEGRPGSTELTGKGSLEGALGQEDLIGDGELEGNPGKEELIGSGQLEGEPGLVELTGIGSLDGNPGKTIFEDNGAELEGTPGQEFFEGDNIRLEGKPGTTELSGEAELVGNPGKESLSGSNTVIEGNPGTVQLEGEGRLEGEPGKVNFLTSGANLDGNLSNANVNLTGADSDLSGEVGKTELESPRVAEASISSVNLTGEGRLEGKPGQTKLSGPETELEGFTGKVKFDSGNANDIEERNIGTVLFEGEGRLEGNPGKVKFKAPEVELESNIGKVRFEEPKINHDIPTKEELEAPKVSRADRDARVNFEGPSIQLEANEGNANLSGPPSNLISENLGNSNPEQDLFDSSENYSEE